jgi:hypothetical protein
VGSIRGTTAFELIQDDLGDGLPHGDAGLTHFSLAEVVTPCLEMVVLDLSVFEGELPSRSLACEVVAVGVFAPSPIGAHVRHLIDKISVVAGHVTPAGGLGGAKEVRRLTMGGKVVEPGTIGTAAAFLVLILGQGVVLCVLTGPGDGAPHSTPQVQGPGFVIGGVSSAMGSVSPCQFPSLTILVHQL